MMLSGKATFFCTGGAGSSGQAERPWVLPHDRKHFLLVLGLVWSRLLAESILVGESSALGPEGKSEIRGFREYIYLESPSGKKDQQVIWRVNRGTLQVSGDGGTSWRQKEGWRLPKVVKGDWEGFSILGAPAVGRDPFQTELVLGRSLRRSTAVVMGDRIIEIAQRPPAEGEDGWTTPLVIAEQPQGSQTHSVLSEFGIHDQLEGLTLMEAVRLEENLLGIDLWSHHGNCLILFDMASLKPIGQMWFFDIQYLPYRQAFWIARPPLARAEQTPDMIEEVVRRAQIVPIRAQGQINPVFLDTRGILPRN